MNTELGGVTAISGLLFALDFPDLLSSMEGVEPVTYRAGESIYSEGDEGGRLFVVLQGKVRVGCHAVDGREHVFTVVGPTEIFGEEAALDAEPMSGCATALTDMHGIVLTTDALVSLMTMNPEVAERFLRVVARRIRWTTTNITDAVYADVTARVAKQLLALAQRFGVQERGATRLQMDLTQEQFACLVGTTRESVSKALCDFNQRGWIETDRDTILIFDSQPLANRTQGQRFPDRRSH